MAQLELSPKAEQDAAKLAQATGLSIAEAVEEAVRLRLFSVAPELREKPSMEELLALIHRGSEQKVDYSVSEDDILGYNESGLFE